MPAEACGLGWVCVQSPSEGNISKLKEIILNCIQYGADAHDHKITKTKLAKLVYFADFTWYYRHLQSMSGFAYRRIQQGPVADAYFRTIDELFESGAIVIEHRGVAQMISATENASHSNLSEDELSLIKEIAAKWQGKPTQEIVDFTHEQLPWKTTSYGDLIPYELITQEPANHIF